MIPKILAYFKRKGKFRVISEANHQINKNEVSLAAINIVKTLQKNGFAAFIVGGAVRDLILQEHPKDFDIATSATPEEIKNLFRRVYLIGRRFRIAHVHLAKEVIEVTTFRGNAQKGMAHQDESGRILSDNIFGTQLEDAMRRDFTINALYYNPLDNTVWDACNGFADLQKRKLQIIGDGKSRFREDPVRILRILRFIAKLDFTIDKKTQSAINSLKNLLPSIPSARLGDEFGKFIMNGYAQRGIEILRQWDLLQLFLISPPVDNQENKYSNYQIIAKEVLTKADERYRNEKRLSLPFIIANLLWVNVVAWFEKLTKQGLHPAIAFQSAMSEVLFLQQKKVFLTKQNSTQIRDIWHLQQNLLYPRVRSIVRLLSHRQLTTAIDFLEIRAQMRGENNLNYTDVKNRSEATAMLSEHPAECEYWSDWWREYLDANSEKREEMFTNWEILIKSQKTPNKNKKRRRKKSVRSIVES